MEVLPESRFVCFIKHDGFSKKKNGTVYLRNNLHCKFCFSFGVSTGGGGGMVEGSVSRGGDGYTIMYT